MDREIRALTPDDETIAEMTKIGVACFGGHYSDGRLSRNWLGAQSGTVFFGVFEGDRLIAFNGFLRHSARQDDRACVLFQSCHSATDPEFRGQGLFSLIINHAKQALDGDYLIGFPNNQSGPIFVNRLGFRQVEMTRVWLPCSAASAALVRAGRYRAAFSLPGFCRPDEHAAAAWKQREWPGELIEFEHEGNMIWGKVATKSVGPAVIRYLNGGGCDLAEPRRLGAALAALGKRFGVNAVRLVCTRTSAMGRAALITFSGARTEPMIWHPLRSEREPVFSVFNGLKDVW